MNVNPATVTELEYSRTKHGHLIIGLNFFDERKPKVDGEFAAKYYNFHHHFDLDQRDDSGKPVQLHMSRSILTVARAEQCYNNVIQEIVQRSAHYLVQEMIKSCDDEKLTLDGQRPCSFLDVLKIIGSDDMKARFARDKSDYFRITYKLVRRFSWSDDQDWIKRACDDVCKVYWCELELPTRNKKHCFNKIGIRCMRTMKPKLQDSEMKAVKCCYYETVSCKVNTRDGFWERLQMDASNLPKRSTKKTEVGNSYGWIRYEKRRENFEEYQLQKFDMAVKNVYLIAQETGATKEMCFSHLSKLFEGICAFCFVSVQFVIYFRSAMV